MLTNAIVMACIIVFGGSALYDLYNKKKEFKSKPNPRHNDLNEIY